MHEKLSGAARVDAMVAQTKRSIDAVNRLEASLDPERDIQAYQEAVERFFEAQEERTLWDIRYSYGRVEGLLGGVELFVPQRNDARHFADVARLYVQLEREARAAGFYLEPSDEARAPIFFLRPLQKERTTPDR